MSQGRVLGVLEPSRTIGDLDEKIGNLKGIVSPVPYIKYVKCIRCAPIPPPPLRTCLMIADPSHSCASRPWPPCLWWWWRYRWTVQHHPAPCYPDIRAVALNIIRSAKVHANTSAPRKTGCLNLLIVASDGVWDVMPTADALAIVNTAIQNGSTPELSARSLSAAAVKRGSQDDVTAIVIHVRT